MAKDDNKVNTRESSWYDHITSSQIDKWRIWPRMLITLYGFMFFKTTEWFMSLPEPTAPQSAFVSVVVGAGAAWFGLYVGSSSGSKK